MSKVLCIDTSVYSCSVAISINGQLGGFAYEKDKNKSAEVLNSLIQEVCNKAQTSLGQLDAIGIVSGPGSYTGLRIASSSAKGLCYGLNIPLISLSSFEAMRIALDTRYDVDKVDQYILTLDARREDVYATLQNKAGEDLITPGPFNLTEKSPFFNAIDSTKNTIIAGDGAIKTSKHLYSIDLFSIVPDFYYDSREMVGRVYEKYLSKKFEDIAYFEPNYTKPAFTTVSKKEAL